MQVKSVTKQNWAQKAQKLLNKYYTQYRLCKNLKNLTYSYSYLLVLHDHLGSVNTAGAGGSGVTEVNVLAVLALQHHRLTAGLPPLQLPPRQLPDLTSSVGVSSAHIMKFGRNGKIVIFQVVNSINLNIYFYT